MKKLKRKIALLLTLCMVLTCITPAYADVETVPEATASDAVIREEDENIEIIEEASPAEAEYDLATPSDAKHIALEKPEKDSEENVAEKATPSNAKKNDEVLIRETTVDEIRITLTADPGVFPDDAGLWAEKVEDETTEEAIEEAVEKERDNNANVASNYKFDIKVLVDGEEVQPDTSKGSVRISFALEEVLNDCFEVNVYHVTGQEALEAEALDTKVETGEKAAKTDEIIDEESEDILFEEPTEGTVVTAKTEGFSYYVVEFTYESLKYTLKGTSTKLSDILSTLGITGIPSKVTVSSEELFTVTEDEGGEDWTVTVLEAFITEQYMSVTIDSLIYKISVLSGLDNAQKINIEYIDENGEEQEAPCIIMTDADGYTFEAGEWYAVTGNVTIKNRIDNKAPDDNPAHLVLADGATLNAQNGIHNGTDKGLVITGQINGSGKLIAEISYSSSATIGTDEKESPGVSKLTFNGGTVTATAKNNAAGIGGGNHSSSGNITINGGTITAKGGTLAAGIGGGNYDNGEITINGGKVTANGGDFAAGIGGGNYGRGVVEITGGTVVSNGGWHGCGIGSGDNNNHSRITIKGGIVTATGYQAGVSIGTGEVNIDSGVLIYAGESRETAIKTDVQGLGAHFAHVAVSTEYTVSHEWQTVDGTGYVPHETEPLLGGAGWHTEAAANSYKGFTAEKFSQETIVSDGSTVVSIKYKRNTNTITFDTNGRAAAPEPIKAVTGAEIKAPQAPVCEGYRFEGWYKEKECTNPFTFTTMPEENLTLYAKWAADPSERQYVQYVDENGSIRTESCIILSTDKDAYAFDTGEWYAATNSITIGSRIENNASESPAHLILTDGALLAVKGGIHNPDGKGLVIYGQSAGSGTLSISDVPRNNTGIGYGYLEDSGKITINGGTVCATGGTFGNGIGGKMTINGGTVTAAGGYGRAALGGNYEGEGGTLVFGRNPGVLRAGSSQDDASDIDVDIYKEKFHDYSFVMINYATASYTVEHWKQKIIRSDDYQYDTTETLTGFVDSYAKVVSKGYPGYGDPRYTPEKIKADGTTKIVAKYDLIYSTILFDANGHGTAPDPIYAVPGAVITAPEDPSAEHYVFGGWYTETECTNRFTFSTMPSEDKTLYAKWIPIQYTITWKDGAKVLRTDKVDYDTMPNYGSNPVKQGYEFVSWWPAVQKVTGDATYNAIFFKQLEQYTITWKDWDGKILATTTIDEGSLPKYPGASKPSRSGYIFTGWTPEIDLATSDKTYTATYEKKSSGGGGGGGGGAISTTKKSGATFSKNWYVDEIGVWRIRNSAGQIVVNAWLCDDAITANGQNVWYLLRQDGAMLAAGLVQDNTGNFYSLETNHDGYFGMLRYQDGYYNCNGQQVYLTFNREHNGSFGAVTNADGLEKLKAIYGITKYGIGTENAVYTATF